MNDRETLDIQLNVMDRYDPLLPESYRRCKFLFLANGSTKLQMKVLDQCTGPSLVVAETMDLWIHRAKAVAGVVQADRRPGLKRRRGQAVDRHRQPCAGGRAVRELGPNFVVIKKGEHGAMFFGEHETYACRLIPRPSGRSDRGRRQFCRRNDGLPGRAG